MPPTHGGAWRVGGERALWSSLSTPLLAASPRPPSPWCRACREGAEGEDLQHQRALSLPSWAQLGATHLSGLLGLLAPYRVAQGRTPPSKEDHQDLNPKIPTPSLLMGAPPLVPENLVQYSSRLPYFPPLLLSSSNFSSLPSPALPTL